MSFFSQGLLSGSGHFSPRHKNREQGGQSLPSMKSNIPREKRTINHNIKPTKKRHVFTGTLIKSYTVIRFAHLVKSPWIGTAVQAAVYKSLGAFRSCQTWWSSKMLWFHPVADHRPHGLTPSSPNRRPASPGCIGLDWLGFDLAWLQDLAVRPERGLTWDPKLSRWVQGWCEDNIYSSDLKLNIRLSAWKKHWKP